MRCWGTGIYMKKSIRPAALLLALLILTAAFAFAACKKDPNAEMNPVVLKLGDLKLTKYYFDSLYGTNKNYYYMSQGALSMEEYFNLVTDEMERYAVTLKAAREKGFTFTAEEEAEIAADAESQWEHIKGVFMEKIDSSLTDPDEIAKAFEDRFVLETGYSSELYRSCLNDALHDRMLIKKLMVSMTEGVEPTEQDVRNQIDLLINAESQSGFASFAAKFRSYAAGEGDPFFFVPEECFAVVQYLVNDGPDAESEIERVDALLESSFSSEDFIDLVASESNDDKTMLDEKARRLGYLVHDSLIDDYTTEFFCAANVANGRKVIPGIQPGVITDYEVFRTVNGKIIVKIADEGCTRYLMVIKNYRKGNVSYTSGDDIWNMGYANAKDKVRQDRFDDAVEEWYQAALKGKDFKWYFDRFKSNYLPKTILD